MDKKHTSGSASGGLTTLNAYNATTEDSLLRALGPFRVQSSDRVLTGLFAKAHVFQLPSYKMGDVSTHGETVET